MSMDATLAARFYDGAAPAFEGPSAAPYGVSPAAPSEGGLRGAAISFAETLRAGEETATAGLAGAADPQSVVTALASSEMAVQTAVTLRDRVVEAYQEILRMPV